MKNKRLLTFLCLILLATGCTSANDSLVPSQGQTAPALQTLSDFVRNIAQAFTNQGINNCSELQSQLNELPNNEPCESGKIKLDAINDFNCVQLSEGATFSLEYSFEDCRNTASSLDGPLSIQFATDGTASQSTLTSIGLIITGVNYTFENIAGPEQCQGTLFANGNPCQLTEDCLNCFF